MAKTNARVRKIPKRTVIITLIMRAFTVAVAIAIVLRTTGVHKPGDHLPEHTRHSRTEAHLGRAGTGRHGERARPILGRPKPLT